jgi:hypothetical protein
MHGTPSSHTVHAPPISLVRPLLDPGTPAIAGTARRHCPLPARREKWPLTVKFVADFAGRLQCDLSSNVSSLRNLPDLA